MCKQKAMWLIGVIALASLPTFAQQISGSIAGTVRDSQQAVVAGAKVSLLNQTQGWTRETTTNDDGVFLLTSLPPATYNVTVETAGFKKFEKRDIKIFANDRMDVQVVLEVGSVTDTITVEATGGELQTTGAERAGVITGNQVVNLALTSRNFLDLMKTVPGVYYPPGGSGIGGFVNGGRNNQNNMSVDGITNVDTGSNGGLLATLNIDQIAEFKVITNSQPAEFGRSSGAQITLVTKGGTRDFHGTGYLFHRHEGLNANNWRFNKDGRQRALYRNNFVGFNVGGPALIPGWNYNRNRDKIFFFVGVEWQNQLQPNNLTNVTVPTALQRTGDFSQTRDGGGVPVIIRDPQANAPFPGNVIPASRLSADGVKILGFYPLPNATGANDYNYQTAIPNQFPRREYIYRGDWNINDKWRVYGRLLKTFSSQNRAYGQWNADYNIPFAPMNFGNPGWSVIANATTVINPTLTNEFIFGSSKNVLNIDPVDDTFKRSKLNLNYKMPFEGDTLGLVQNWRFGGVPSAPFTNFSGTPFRNFNHTYDVTDNITKIWGVHTFKAGIWMQKSLKDQTAFTSVNGDIWFDRDSQNPGDTNWAFSNAIMGNFQRLAQSNKVLNGQYRYWNVEWYVQDSWRVSKRLTIDAGVRFYIIQPQYDAALQTSSFNPGLYNQSSRAVLMQPTLNAQGQRSAVNPLNGQIFPASYIGSIVNTGNGFVNGLYANGMGLAGKGDYPRGLIDSRGIHYAPRLGLAYKLTEKTVIRSGFGTFYDRFQGNPVFDMLPNVPSTTRPTYFYGTLAGIQSTQGVFFPGSVRGFDKKGEVPTTYNWNFTVQHEIFKGTLLDVAYVGSRSTHLLGRTDFNALPLGSAWLPQNQDPTMTPRFDGTTTLPPNLYRPYAGFDSGQVTTFGAMSNYHALQVGLTRNLVSCLK